MRYCIFDLEADNLLDEVTKVHIIGYQWEDEDEVKFITDEARMKKFFQQKDVIFVGHNIVLYDMRVVKKLWGIDVPYKRCIDTLPLSWYLYDDRVKHSLESWGPEVGISKVEVGKDEWVEGNMSLMTDRVREDVKINTRLWKLFKWNLEELYEGDWKQIEKLIHYQGFKLDCIREQEETGVRLDVPRIKKALEGLYKERDSRVEILAKAMPKVPVKGKKSPPKVKYKKDGEPSVLFIKWREFLKEKGISEDFEGEVEYIKDYKEPNPASSSQVKDWLYSLGWVPEHIKFVRNKETNETKQIPQTTDKNDRTEICPSVKKLAEKEPAIDALAGLSVINHRIGILEGFLRDKDDNDFVYPTASSLTSTFRLKHRVLVNLPSKHAPFAEDIRRSILPPEGHIMIGSDLKGIEDNTKRHYIYPYDPEYVKEQMVDGFDAHLDIGIFAGIITEEEAEFYKKNKKNLESLNEEDRKRWDEIDVKRHKSKTTNFSSIYLIGAKALARALGITESAAQGLLDGYWKRNWAVKDFSADCSIKRVDERMFVLNPISTFWMPLRNEKDIFSAVNQSSAVYVFDMWLAFIRSYGIKISYQYHDEALLYTTPDKVEEYLNILDKSMERVNNLLKLNVTIGCDSNTGDNYGDCH